MKLTFGLIVVLLVGSSSGLIPSDMISYQDAPKVLDLQHVKPSSAKAIDEDNAGLKAYRPWILPNFGHYGSETLAVVQEKSDTLTPALLNFTGVLPLESDLPASVGNETGNFTVIEDIAYL